MNESNTGTRVVVWVILISAVALASWLSGFPWNYIQP
jgi:hypothetical protein